MQHQAQAHGETAEAKIVLDPYPIHLWRPGFQDLGHKFPAHDAHVLRWLAGLASQRHDPVFAEIGSFVGTTALILSEFAPVRCFDTWKGGGDPDDPINDLFARHDVEAMFRQNVREMPTKHAIYAHRVNTRYRYDWYHLQFDLFFIDGDHSCECVNEDYIEASQSMKPGGILCGHDFGVFPGVTRVVNELGYDGRQGSMWWKFF